MIFSLLTLALSLSLGYRDFEVRDPARRLLSRDPMVSLAVSCVCWYHHDLEVRRYHPRQDFIEFCQIVNYNRSEIDDAHFPLDAMVRWKFISKEEAESLLEHGCIISPDCQYVVVPRYYTTHRFAARTILPGVLLR